MRFALSPLLASLLLSGCPDRAPAPVPRLDLTRSASSPAPRVILAPAALKTAADFDALEQRFLERREPQALMTALTMLTDAALAGPSLTEEDALLIQRLAILHLALADSDAASQVEGAERHTQRALELAMKLADRAPRSPHSLFLQGYVPFTQIGGSDRRDAFVDPTDAARRPFWDAIITRWGLLLDAQPDYQGPRGFSAARIRSAIELVKDATRQQPRVGAPEAPAREASREEAFAMSELARLERSPDGTRTTGCRDWLAGQGASRESAAELRLSVFCATYSRHPNAVTFIERLGDIDGEAFDPCMALARVADRVPKADLATQLVGSGLPLLCP